MKRIIVIVALLGFYLGSYAGALRDSAEQFYQDGRYEDAIALWDSISQSEGTSPELLYNTGNAYYKLGMHAKAVLNYERARLLAPEDEDIQHNIQVVEAQLRDQIEAIPELFFIVWLNKLNMWISGTAWGILSIVLFVTFLGIMLWRLFRRKSEGNRLITYLSVLILLISGTCLSLALRSNALKNKSGEGIIMQDILVKSSPSETGTNLFEIHEGLKVEIQDSVNGFSEIRLADGKKGWINSLSLENI